MEEILSTEAPLLLTIGISLIMIMLLTPLGYIAGLFDSVMLGTLWIIPEFPFLQWVKPDREARKLQAATFLFNCRVNGSKMQPFEIFIFAKDLADFIQALDMAEKNWVNLSALHNLLLSSSNQFQKNLREQNYWVEEIAAPLYEKLQRVVADECNTFHWPYAPDLRPNPRRDDQGASVPPYYILWDNVNPQTIKYLKWGGW